MAQVDVPKTFGALLIGGILAALFSGVIQAQTFVYFRLYGGDPLTLKLLVLAVWLLDTLHTAFIGHSLWNYLIIGFGDAAGIDYVPTSLALTIAVTAILTFGVHLFFIYRVFVLSDRNYYIGVSLGLLACTRLCLASLTTAKLIELRSLEEFVRLFSWSYTCGLTLSAILDVIVTTLMCWFLKTSQREFSKLNEVLDSLILYAFENGILTTLGALLALITWLTMPTNLIFMAAHFIVIKFYANSLLATLNARRDLNPERRPQDTLSASGIAHTAGADTTHHSVSRIPRPIVFSSDEFERFRLSRSRHSMKRYSGSDTPDDDEDLRDVGKTSQLQITVDTTTTRIVDPTREEMSGSRSANYV